MKKAFCLGSILFILLVLLAFSGCTDNDENEVTETVETIGEESTVILYGYLVNEVDGMTSYEINGSIYEYRIVLLGRSNNAVKYTRYTVLTNDESITFEMVDRYFWSSQLQEVDFRIVKVESVEE